MIRPGASASSATLPLYYLAVSATAFVLAALAVPWLASELAGHYYHPRLLGLTHTVTLGWITVTIMGASYQLIPIVLERPIASERLARIQLPVIALGVVGVIGHFLIAEWSGFAWSAGLVAVAALVHVAHAGRSVVRAERSFTAGMFAMSLAGLALTVLFGTALGADKVRPFLPGAFFPMLHAHVHLALLGWVLPVVLGVAARVYPMFLLAAEPTRPVLLTQGVGLAIGIPLVVGGLLVEASSVTLIGAVAVAVAIAVHVGSVLAMARARKRPRLDWGLRFVLAGASALVPATALGLGLATGVVSGPRAAIAYGVLAFGGWITLTIIGMMLKIVPFLVWYRVYAGHVGRVVVPTLAQLSSPRLEAASFVLLVAGVGALALGVGAGHVVTIRAAGAIVALGALAFGLSLARVLRHLAVRPAQPRAAARRLSAVS
jgi:hypothetical protein